MEAALDLRRRRKCGGSEDMAMAVEAQRGYDSDDATVKNYKDMTGNARRWLAFKNFAWADDAVVGGMNNYNYICWVLSDSRWILCR
jgi:hypothetical protein